MVEMYCGLEKIEHMKNMLIGKSNADAFDRLQKNCSRYSECYGGCHKCAEQFKTVEAADAVTTYPALKSGRGMNETNG